jgi:hypothetical protein
MIPGNFIPVIKTLSSQCDSQGLTWAFTGSLNLALWGVELEPHDIDLETNRYGAEQFDHLHAARAVWSLHLRKTEFMQSWFARYDFDGVQVEVMGDCRYHQADGSLSGLRPLEKRIRRMDWQGLTLPLLDLKDEMEGCRLMGRLGKAERIQTWLAEHSENM